MNRIDELALTFSNEYFFSHVEELDSVLLTLSQQKKDVPNDEVARTLFRMKAAIYDDFLWYIYVLTQHICLFAESHTHRHTHRH